MARNPRFDLQKYFDKLYAQTPGEFAFQARSPAELRRWQEAFRPRLREALGLDHMDADLAGWQPTAQKTESVDMGSYTREKWYVRTEPDVPLAIWLLKPKDLPGRLPLVLTPHGHNHPGIYAGLYNSPAERQAGNQGERDIAVQAVEQGYLAIAPTTRGFGETARRKDLQSGGTDSCRLQLLHSLLVGRTPIGQRAWDMSRLIDWALERDDVDGSRIAMTGNSGGGTVTVFAAACDERISVAVPSCYFCTFAGSIGSIHHCDCNYVPGVLRLGEMHDVAGLTAPRPISVITGRTDRIFPLREVRKAYRHLKRIYQVAHAADRCQLHVGPDGHRYYKAGCWPFLHKHFAQP